MNGVRLVIVVPCYNEEEVLKETTRQLSDVLARMEKEEKIAEGKILYVDDGSRDLTWALIEQLSESNRYVAGLKLAHNVGHQQALWAGLELVAGSDYDAAVSIDADLQDDVNAITEMVDYFLQGVDVVFGVRRERKTDTFFKKHTAQLFYKLMSTMGGEIVYNHADFRLMSKRSLKALVSFPERNLFLRGMVCLLGYTTASVYYDRKERFAGESKYPFTKMLNFAHGDVIMIGAFVMLSALTSGLIFMLVSFFAIIYALVEFIGGDVIRGWTSLLISVWFIGGAILTAVGIIGEYIGKIYKEVKRRPRYLIEKEVNL